MPVSSGPCAFNLGLACLLESVESVSGKFFEPKHRFDWHAGLLMENCTLQAPLHSGPGHDGRPPHPLQLLELPASARPVVPVPLRQDFHAPRTDSNRYCRWASEQLDCLEFSSKGVGVEKQGPLYARLINRCVGVNVGSGSFNQGCSYDSLGRMITRVDRKGKGDGVETSDTVSARSG